MSLCWVSIRNFKFLLVPENIISVFRSTHSIIFIDDCHFHRLGSSPNHRLVITQRWLPRPYHTRGACIHPADPLPIVRDSYDLRWIPWHCRAPSIGQIGRLLALSQTMDWILAQAPMPINRSASNIQAKRCGCMHQPSYEYSIDTQSKQNENTMHHYDYINNGNHIFIDNFNQIQSIRYLIESRPSAQVLYDCVADVLERVRVLQRNVCGRFHGRAPKTSVILANI